MTIIKTQKKSAHPAKKTKDLLDKWEPILDVEGLPKLTDPLRRRITATVLENTVNDLKSRLSAEKDIWKTVSKTVSSESNEESTETETDTNALAYDPLLLHLIRAALPQLPIYELCGVQPITGPTGHVFSLRSHYSDDDQVTSKSNKDIYDCEKALFDIEDSDSDSDISFDNSVGYSMDTLTAVAMTKQLKIDYSREIHKLDGGQEEIRELAIDEFINRTTRDILKAIYISAERGGNKDGTIDVSDGAKWVAERYNNLYKHIMKDIDEVERRTQRGKGNILICSKEVAAGLSTAGHLVEDLNVPRNSYPTGHYNLYVGRLRNVSGHTVKVFVDSQMGNEDEGFYVVGYKGVRECDTGLIYSPYIPFDIMTAISENDFHPVISFATRYALIFNPRMATDYDGDDVNTTHRNNNRYYRKVIVKGLLGLEYDESDKDTDSFEYLEGLEKSNQDRRKKDKELQKKMKNYCDILINDYKKGLQKPDKDVKDTTDFLQEKRDSDRALARVSLKLYEQEYNDAEARYKQAQKEADLWKDEHDRLLAKYHKSKDIYYRSYNEEDVDGKHKQEDSSD